MSDFEIVKSEYNALDETGNYKTHYFRTSADQVVGLSTVGLTGSYNDLKNKPVVVTSINGQTGDVVVEGVPTGFIASYGGSDVPTGWLSCNGATVSRTTYATLFSAIGTTYGAGDGNTTFNLPNHNNGSFLEGSDTAGTVKSAGLPNITGSMRWIFMGYTSYNGNAYSGALNVNTSGSTQTGIPDGGFMGSSYPITFDASRSSSVYGNATTVQPKSVTVKFCIKY